MKLSQNLSSWPVVIAFVMCSSLFAQAGSPGSSIFNSKCIVCHGTDGNGQTPLGKQLQAANLHSKQVQGRTDAELRKIVHDGQANMPSFADQLSDEEIAQVVQYVRQFGKAPAKKK